MYSSLSFLPSGPCARVTLLLAFLLPALGCIVWYGVNSDRDDIPPLLTHLIPAGHATCSSSANFQCSACRASADAYIDQNGTDRWTFDHFRDAGNEGLTEQQCASAFPGLFEDVHQGVTYWKTHENITFRTLDAVQLQNGMTRASISHGHLYVVATKSKAEDHRRKMLAVLSAMHRALAAAQDKSSIRDIEFVFSIEDKASDVTGSRSQPLWVLARKSTERSFFLIPDFGLWAWDLMGSHVNTMGPYDEVVVKAVAVEETVPFQKKTPRLVWRGKLSFAPKLRRVLLDACRGKSWSDVKELNWHVRKNYLTLDDHCKYKFIAHVEGRSYSASLKYRQACKSVVVAHKLPRTISDNGSGSMLLACSLERVWKRLPACEAMV